MPRAPRCTLPEVGTYHAYNRGVERRAIFVDDVDRRRFLSFLRLATRRSGWIVDAYTLMGNHFHLLVTTQLDRLTVGMHTLCFRYAQTFNARHTRTGHLFQGRFGTRVVGAEDDFFGICDYVFANPVRQGLCGTAGEYPWSGGDYFPLYRGLPFGKAAATVLTDESIKEREPGHGDG